MKSTAIFAAFAVLMIAIPSALAATWVSSAKARGVDAQAAPAASGVQVAAAADEQYCTPELKRILRRVLQSCGLMSEGGGGGRGCQPVQAKNVATMSGSDFNALFRPMKERGGIVQFDRDSANLDPVDNALIDKVFADQRGASYFFVVSRASPEGSVEHNRDLSQSRAESVMSHLRSQFNDPDLDKEVGLLWLGEEFAQLEDEFCSWERSAPIDAAGTGATCDAQALNRSAFIAWIDCTL